MKNQPKGPPANRFRKLIREIRKNSASVDYERKHRDKLWERVTELADRMQDVEVQLNVTTRVLTHICTEELGMGPAKLKKLLKLIEKETREDQQIIMLENLFKKKSRPREERSGLDEAAG